jgi:hypothetical protein
VNLRWLWRMALWARRPPSARQLRFLLVMLALCLGIALVEYVAGWPAMLTPAPMRLP